MANEGTKTVVFHFTPPDHVQGVSEEQANTEHTLFIRPFNVPKLSTLKLPAIAQA